MAFIGRHLYRHPVLVALCVTIALSLTGVLAPLQHALADLHARLFQQTVPSDVIIVEIDARSLQSLPVWPWPRRYYANVLERLRHAGAKRIFVDIDFSAESNAQDDRLLEEALQKFSPNTVILPVFRQYTTSGNQTSLLLTKPLPSLRQNAVLASVNVHPDKDGLVRRIFFDEQKYAENYPTVAEILAEQENLALEELYIDYSIRPNSFDRVSFVDIFNSDVPLEMFSGKKVIVGATAVELGDLLPVPIYQSLPGSIMQAIAYQSIHVGPLRQIPVWITILVVLLISASLAKVLNRLEWNKDLLIINFVAVIAISTSVYAYITHRLLIDTAPILVLLVLCAAFTLLAKLDQQSLHLLLQRLDLKRKDTLMTNIVENSIDGIVTINENGVIESANSAIERMFAYPANTLVGKSVTMLIPALRDSNWLQAIYQHRNESGNRYELNGQRYDGSKFVVELALSELTLNERCLYTAILRDISERKARLAQLKYQATHDALTGLVNRTLLFEMLQDVIYSEDSSSAALLMLDLDRFKEINDTLGHSIGDRILCEIANRFSAQLPEYASIARVGGDEFAVLVRRCDVENAEIDIANNLLHCLRKPFPIEGIALEVGLSIGIALYPQHANDAETLMQHADVAMYLAKKERSGYAVYDAELDRHSVRRLALSGDLRTAIEANQLVMYYQPKIELASGRLFGVEALVRWQHPRLGFVAPDEFIEIAESTDLIKPLTEWTLTETLRQCAHWRQKGFDVCVAVNLSARHLQDRNFINVLNVCLEKSQAQAQWLELEITESAFMSDPERALEIVNEIASLGIQLAIDDFGTGYSSLSYLKHLPIHQLKIDKSFVMEMNDNENDRSIVRSTIELAHALELQVIAEGVESEHLMTELLAMNCDYGQGYWFSRPIPNKAFMAWMQNWNLQQQDWLNSDQNRLSA